VGAWRAIATHGFADLSPPEAQHAFLELPTNRAKYVGLVQDLGDYPERSPIGQRAPSAAEIADLARAGGRWRAVVLLEDEAAARQAACAFEGVYVLDPLYDTGALLYAAWHDPFIRDEHSRRLAEQAAGLVRLAPLLTGGTAVLAPDHLPGSWSPRPGWRRPRPTDNPRQVAGWWMRAAMVLVYWADRLDAVVCVTSDAVVSALHAALGQHIAVQHVTLGAPPPTEEVAAWRTDQEAKLAESWSRMRDAARRRPRRCLGELASALQELPLGGVERDWQLALGDNTLPEPVMLIRRVLNGQAPGREPPLPRRRLRRRPLCLLGSERLALSAEDGAQPYA
jgi:hypothetical protein